MEDNYKRLSEWLQSNITTQFEKIEEIYTDIELSRQTVEICVIERYVSIEVFKAAASKKTLPEIKEEMMRVLKDQYIHHWVNENGIIVEKEATKGRNGNYVLRRIEGVKLAEAKKILHYCIMLITDKAEPKQTKMEL